MTRCDPPATRASRRRPGAAVRCCALAAIPLILEPFAGARALAESAGGALARCRVQTLAASSSNEAMIADLPLLSVNPTDESREDYRPVVSKDPLAEPDPAVLRLKINYPGGVRTVRLETLIKGVGYRAARAAWIDGVLNQAGDKGKDSAQESAVETPLAIDFGGVPTKEELMAEPEPGVAIRRRKQPTLRERLLAYVAAVGPDVDRAEIGWLLDRWSNGPAVTLLGPGRSWQRAGVAPLWTLLDADADGGLSSEEISTMNQTLQAADINQDGVVSLVEAKRRNRDRSPRMPSPRTPLVEVDAATPADAPADLSLRVDFAGEAGRVELLSVSGTAAEPLATDDQITVDFQPEYFELAAAEEATSGPRGDAPDQIAIGAVVDGSPLWRLADLDGDDRLTASEVRTLPGLLEELDLDNDGAVVAAETPLAIRLVVGRGPIVHRLLESRAAAIGRKAPEPSAPAPEWFAAMDRNRDGELSREEFSGAASQFNALDADSSGYVSVAEALEAAQ